MTASCAGPSGRDCVAPQVLVVMGVSGCGKSTVASLVARQLGLPFYEGDTYHPPSNIEKMQGGIPLTDADREPWLLELAAIVQAHCASGQPAVLSCSALKPAYRQLLRGEQPLVTTGGVQWEAGSSGCGSSSGSGGVSRTEEHVTAVPPSAGRDCQQRDGAAACTTCSGEGDIGCSPEPCCCGRAAEETVAGVGFVLLEPSRSQLQQWVAAREAAGGHFMPPSLLDSQLAALEYRPEELYLCFAGDPFPPPEQIAASVAAAWAGAGQVWGCGRLGEAQRGQQE